MKYSVIGLVLTLLMTATPFSVVAEQSGITSAGAPLALTAQASDTQSAIAALIAQMQILQQKLAELKAKIAQQTQTVTPSHDNSPRWCRISRTLALGAQGGDVVYLQELLREIGYFAGDATGYFGSVTANSVARWQNAEGIEAAGSFGPISRALVYYKWCGNPTPSNQGFSASPVGGASPQILVGSTVSCSPINYLPAPCSDGSQPQPVKDSNGCTLGFECPMVIFTPPPKQSAFRVVSPNGGETLNFGQLFTIKWNTDGSQLGGTGSNVVKLSLIPEAQTQRDLRPLTIGNFRASDGTYTWTPAAALAGGTYKLRAQLTDGVCTPIGPYPFRDGANCLAVARLLASDDSDGWFSISGNTSTNKAPVISSFSGPTTLSIGQTGTWAINASDPENGVLSYSVTWGDEAAIPYGLSSSAKPTTDAFVQKTTFTHSYASAGVYTVSIMVKDVAGQTAQTSATVKVGETTVACTMVYAPVCGRVTRYNTCSPSSSTEFCAAYVAATEEQTYSNKCLLEAAGATYLHDGECKENKVSGFPISVSPGAVARNSPLAISWSSDPAPNAAVFLWLVNDQNGSNIGMIEGSQPASGSISWTVPWEECTEMNSPTNQICVPPNDYSGVWSVKPGMYHIEAKIVSPPNACFGFCPSTENKIIDTAKSLSFWVL